jgi:DNA polymerase-3 subunit beta
MKLSCTTAELLAQLQLATRVASTRSAVQALSGVKLDVGPDGAYVLATDMEVGIRVPLEATVEREGQAVVPARLLLDVVRALPSGPMTLELRPTTQDVELLAGAATFHLRTLRAEDFPPLPAPDEDARTTVPAQAFVQTVAKVARSASRDETRPVLTGILVSAGDRELSMVATDSYRLSVKETQLEEPIAGSFQANVPARALQELARIAQQAEQVAVSARQNQIVFEIDGILLTSRLIDGQFPNFRQLMPDSVEHEVRMATAEIADVVRRVSLLAQKNAPLRLTFSQGQLTVSAQTPDIGEASESLPAPFTGDTFEIGFNPEFLRDGLDSVDGGDLVLKLISPLRPGLIESVDESGFVYLIMPIRLNA